MPDDPVSPQHRSEPDASVRVVPTLFIGLGGTGAQVLLRLRRRILAHAWGRPDAPVWLSSLAEFPAAQFLYFDVGNQSSNKPVAKTAQLDELVRFTDSERLGRAINLDQYFRDDTFLGRYPIIESWFPMHPRQVREWCQEEDRRSSHNQPTRAPRCFSRLLFFHEYQRIRQAFQTRLNCLRAGLTNREALERLGLGIEQNRGRIVIIGSIAGGTGSGAFLDMGYLAKQLGKQTFDRCDVDLPILLPSCFKGDLQTDKEAIAYAALMELETLLSDGPRNFVQKWAEEDPDGDIPADPFDNVFLFDAGNLAGERADQIDDLFDMASSVLFDDCKPTDFADLKRRLAAGWRLYNKYKHDPYIAPIDRKYGDLNLRYCGQFLSLGQSSIATELASRRDEIASQHVSVMLRAFFGIADDSGPGCKPPPVPADARALLDTYAHGIAEASEERILEIIHATDRASTGSRKAMNGPHVSCQVIPASTSELDAARRLDPATALEWARQHFGADGAQVVLQQLQDSHVRALMLGRLQTFALQKLPPLGLGDENPLIKALEDMPAPQRRDYFERCLKMAMPWIEADVHDDWFTGPGMYICIVGVNGSKAFAHRFGDEVRAAVPAATRLSPDIRFVETDEPGRLTCYVELAGIPLTALSKLRKWRTSYEGNRDTFPLHIHRNSTQFRHPTAPTDQELERLVGDYQIFLEGVMTGVLTPRKGIYGFTSGPGQRLDIGSEAHVRKDGVYLLHKEPIREQTAAVLRGEGDESAAAMYALCHYYRSYVYPRAKLTAHEQTVHVTGMSTFVVEAMAEGRPEADMAGYRNQLRHYKPEQVVDVLLRPENIDRWSREIPGTEDDGWKCEVRRPTVDDPMDDQYPYYVKRSLREGWQTAVKQLLAPATSSSPTVAGGSPDVAKQTSSPQSGRMAYVAVAGQQSGPFPESTIRTMIHSGQLNPSATHVWWRGLPAWVLLKDCPDLFATIPPPPPGGGPG